MILKLPWKNQMYFVVLTLLAMYPIIGRSATCTLPSGLSSWSALYGANVVSDITITVPVLVDMPSIVAQGIILGQGGALYFDQTKPTITLATNYIRINSGGGLFIGSESCPYTSQANIMLTGQATVDPTMGGNFIGVASGGTIELHGAKGLVKSWTKLVKTATAQATTIQVLDLISWQVGDQIVIASTDYSPVQSEVVTITSISGGIVGFTPALLWDHFGMVTQNVDERAEVGLLTRNIHIYGYNRGTYYGGHLMILAGFLAAHIEGVEFSNMGQDLLGRYPIHFHMCGNVPQGTYARYNSIHDSNFRCITIHASNGVLIQGNVAYKNYGHCYFLEDGVEVNNTITGNLAVLTQPKDFGERIGSDATGTGLSSYWITNPSNYIENNVAAGSFTAGFWIITRLGARGASACLPQYQNLPKFISNLPLGSFSGNTAHSCSFGLGMESTNWDAGDMPRQTCDTPVSNWEPRNADNSIPYTYFNNFTAHHIRDRGVWARMPNIIVNNGRFADNYESIEYATSGDMPPYASQQIVQNSIIVGFSDNKGNHEPVITWQQWDTTLLQSVPSQGNTPMNGIKIYDGPQVLLNCVFVNFPIVATRVGDAAIGARLADQSQVATTNYVQKVQFINVGARFAVLDNTMDGGITGNFRDTDGSVSGYYGATILRNFLYYKTSGCVASSSYGLVCPHRYGQLWVMDMTSNGAGNTMTITRTNYPLSEAASSHSLNFIGFLSGISYRYQPIVSLGGSYLIQFLNTVSSSLVLQLNNAEQNDVVQLALCYPLGTVINSVQRGFANYYGNPYPIIQAQSSVSTIPASASSTTSDSYTFDTANAILYLRIQQRNARTDYGNFCPSAGCDWLWINAKFTISAAAHDCSAAYAANAGVSALSDAATTWISQTLVPAAPLASVLNTLVSGQSSATASATVAPTVAPTIKPTVGGFGAQSVDSVPAATAAPVVAATPAPVAATAAPVATSAPAAATAPASAATPAPTCLAVCATGLSCCGRACYNSNKYTCFNGNILCGAGFSACGTSCYLSSVYKCVNSALAPA